MHLCRERGNRKNPVCKFQLDIPKKSSLTHQMSTHRNISIKMKTGCKLLDTGIEKYTARLMQDANTTYVT